MSAVTARARMARLTRTWETNVGDYVVASAATTDGGSLVVGTASGDIRVIDAASGATRSHWAGNQGGVLALTVHRAKHWVASGGRDGFVRLRSLMGDPIGKFKTDAPWVEHVVWAPSGNTLAAAAGRQMSILDVSGRLRAQSSVRPSTVSGLAWSADPEQLWSSELGSARQWNPTTGEEVKCLICPGSLLSVAVRPNASEVVCAAQDRTVRYFRTSDSLGGTLQEAKYKPTPLCWSPCARWLVQGGCEQAIIWDFLASASSSLASATQEPPLSQVLDFHLAKISAVAFANETGILATASVDGSIAIWDLALGSRLGFYMVDDAVTSMNWLGKSRSLCACTSTGAVVALRFAA